MALEAARTLSSVLAGKGNEHSDAKDGQDAADLSAVTVAVNNGAGAISASVAPANAGIAAGLPSLGLGASQVFTLHFYQRLPHPLSHLLKEILVVDSTDATLLCDFLLKVLKIRQVGQMTEPNIYEFVYLYCRGESLTLVTNAITSRETFESSHARLLGQFIPSRHV